MTIRISEHVASFARVALPACVLALVAGCAAVESGSSLQAGGDGSETRPTTSETRPTAAGPVDQMTSEKERRWQQAIAGLDFSSGRVEVESSGLEDPAAAARAYEEGLEELARNDYVAAIGAFRDALAAWRDFPEAVRALGDATRRKGKLDWAIASYGTFLDVYPDNAGVRFDLAVLLWMQDEREEAISAMNRVVELDPDNADAHSFLARWHYYAGDYRKAWSHVHAARAAGGDVPAQFIPLLRQRMPDPHASAGAAGGAG